MKKIFALLLATLMGASMLTGCGSGDASAEAPETPEVPTAETVAAEEIQLPEAGTGVIKKVALVTELSAVDAEPFSQACWQGVEAWCSENGVACASYQPTDDSTDARVVCVAKAIAEGANTIVMPGRVYGETIPVVQDVYPDVYFIAVDVSENDLAFRSPAENVACLTFSEEQAGYLAGYAAVKEGYTRLGILGNEAVPTVMRYGDGFIQGADAAAVELDVRVQINYIDGDQLQSSYERTAKMEEWYKGGTQLVFACGDAFSSALEAARNSGGKIIGADVDCSSVDPVCIVTTAGKELGYVTEMILEALNDDRWTACGGKISNFSLTEGAYVGLPTDTWTMEKFTTDEYEALKAQIADGTIVVKSGTGTIPETSDKTTVTVSESEE